MWDSDVQPDVELGICQPSQRIDGAGTGASRERPTPPPHQDVELGFFSDFLFHDSAHDLGGVSDGRSALSQHTHTHTSTVWEEQARNSEFSKPNGTDWREEEEERQRWSLDSGRRETMDTPILRSEGSDERLCSLMKERPDNPDDSSDFLRDLERRCPQVASLLSRTREHREALFVAHTPYQKWYIWANMAAPSLTMLVSLFIYYTLVGAMLSFHLVSCVILPCIYIALYFGHREFVPQMRLLWASSSLHVGTQTKTGLVYFAAVGSTLLLAYYIAGKSLIPNRGSSVTSLGLSAEPTSLVLFSVYFSALNPLFEEFFWRVFLPHALGFSEWSLWLSSFFYALYHVFVLHALGFPAWILGHMF